jgi:PAS domain S-box-containing protein
VVVRRACGEAVTERRQRLAWCKRLLFEEALGFFPQGVLFADARPPAFEICYVNRTFARLTGRPAAALVGRGLRELHRPDDDAFPSCVLDDALRAECPADAEWRQVRPDGTVVWLEMALRPVRAENGWMTHFLLVLTDRKTRTRLEAQLRSARSAEAMRRLVRTVAPDLNDLLVTLCRRGGVLLQDTAPDSACHEGALRLLRAGTLAGRLASQLMSLSEDRPEESETSDLNVVVEETLQRLDGEIGPGVKISKSLKASATVRAGPERVRAVVANLLLRACSALPRGGFLRARTADVTGEVTAPPGRYVGLEVSHGSDGPLPKEPWLALDYDLIRDAGGLVETEERFGPVDNVRILFPRADLPTPSAVRT